MRLSHWGVAPLVLGAAGCALNASPADGLRFAAPPGWQSSPGIMGFMQFWRPQANDHEALILFKSPKPIQVSDVVSQPGVGDTLKSATVERRESILICDRQPATYMEARGTSSRGEESRVEMVMTNLRGNTYFALYVRPAAASPNPMAKAALRELCPKP
jgi:hypothetical protein